jgi:CBS domain-containing protein
MLAYQIMTGRVTTVQPETPIAEAADLMLAKRVSGLPVIDKTGKLVGIVSEGDFLRRGEIGTERRRSGLLEFFAGPGKLAAEFVRQEGRTVADIMTRDPVTIDENQPLEIIVQLMEQKGIKRLPVMRGDALIGIITRANLLQAVANLARGATRPSATDDDLRRQILTTMERQPWCPMGLNVVVKDGVADLSGVITDDRQRDAALVATRNVVGVKAVYDHLCWVDAMSGYYIDPREEEIAKAS